MNIVPHIDHFLTCGDWTFEGKIEGGAIAKVLLKSSIDVCPDAIKKEYKERLTTEYYGFKYRTPDFEYIEQLANAAILQPNIKWTKKKNGHLVNIVVNAYTNNDALGQTIRYVEEYGYKQRSFGSVEVFEDNVIRGVCSALVQTRIMLVLMTGSPAQFSIFSKKPKAAFACYVMSALRLPMPVFVAIHMYDEYFPLKFQKQLHKNLLNIFKPFNTRVFRSRVRDKNDEYVLILTAPKGGLKLEHRSLFWLDTQVFMIKYAKIFVYPGTLSEKYLEHHTRITEDWCELGVSNYKPKPVAPMDDYRKKIRSITPGMGYELENNARIVVDKRIMHNAFRRAIESIFLFEYRTKNVLVTLLLPSANNKLHRAIKFVAIRNFVHDVISVDGSKYATVEIPIAQYTATNALEESKLTLYFKFLRERKRKRTIENYCLTLCTVELENVGVFGKKIHLHHKVRETKFSLRVQLEMSRLVATDGFCDGTSPAYASDIFYTALAG